MALFSPSAPLLQLIEAPPPPFLSPISLTSTPEEEVANLAVLMDTPQKTPKKRTSSPKGKGKRAKKPSVRTLSLGGKGASPIIDVVTISPESKAHKAMKPRGTSKKAPKAKRAKKAATGGGGGHRKRQESYGSYIYKVLKQVHRDTSISRKAMGIMDSFVDLMFERIAGEAGRLARMNKRNTITSREIQTACRIVLPGELVKHSVSEGTKAVTKYNISQASA